jgi:hypothetical protein
LGRQAGHHALLTVVLVYLLHDLILLVYVVSIALGTPNFYGIRIPFIIPIILLLVVIGLLLFIF